MRNWTGLHRYAYLRYLSDSLQKNKETLWPIINATAEKWAQTSAGTPFHTYVIEHGLLGSVLPGFEAFMATEYHDPKVAGSIFQAVENMELWAEEHGAPLPDDYRGL